MSNIVIYEKPLLAVLESHKKMRDYSDEERMTISKDLIKNLLNDLGVGKNSDTQHHIRAIKHTYDTLGHYTPEEVKHAFTMFISHKLNIDVYQQLNSVVIGRVMREYEIQKIDKLRLYKQKMAELKNKEKEMSEEDKEFIMLEAVDRIKKEVQQNGTIVSNVIGVYMYLYSKGVLPEHTKEFKEKYTKLAIPIARGEAASKATYSLDDHRKLKERIESITQGKGEAIKNIAKRLILTDYFKG